MDVVGRERRLLAPLLHRHLCTVALKLQALQHGHHNVRLLQDRQPHALLFAASQIQTTCCLHHVCVDCWHAPA